MDAFPTTPEGFLNPLAAAVIAQMFALWLRHYLPDWRWRELALLGLSIAIQCAALLAADLPLTAAHALRAVWLGLIGASVAAFGLEAVLNIAGLLEAGPRATGCLQARLGSGWRKGV